MATTAVWSAFETAWKAAAQTALAKCDAMNAHMNMDHGDMGVLGKLSMMETHMVDHLEVVRAQKAALEPLFKALKGAKAPAIIVGAGALARADGAAVLKNALPGRHRPGSRSPRTRP